jgi:hypothetical protein
MTRSIRLRTLLNTELLENSEAINKELNNLMQQFDGQQITEANQRASDMYSAAIELVVVLAVTGHCADHRLRPAPDPQHHPAHRAGA